MSEIHIGIEIHCELNTRSKMFSSAPVVSKERPNTAVTVMDLAFPGYLPTVNRQAVRYGLLVCDALHCQIDSLLRFDRKNYSYVDLPKGFQITQQFHPLGKNGFLNVGEDLIPVLRVHLEEDTAKLVHQGQETLADFNRCGIPLLEIVSAPVISSVEQACAYVKTLSLLLVYLGVSEGRMDKGQIRCDVNISLSQDPQQLGTRVELKNLNSISHMKKALEYEILRQSQLLENGLPVLSQTRRYNEKTKTTVLLRKKETVLDYRYFPEPNLPPIPLPSAWIKEILGNRPLYPQEIQEILINEHAFSQQEAVQLMEHKPLTEYYFAIVSHTDYRRDVFHILCTDVLRGLRSGAMSLQADPKAFADIINLQKKGLSKNRIREWIALLLQGKPVAQSIQDALETIPHTKQIESWIHNVCMQNPQSIQDYKNGRKRALSYLVGQVLKSSQGQADPKLVQKMLQDMIESY